MYSDMSRVISELSSPKRNSDSVLASSVLPTPVGPRKMNEPLGRFGILEAGPGAADRLADRPDGVLLADDPLVELALHVEELGWVSSSVSL